MSDTVPAATAPHPATPDAAPVRDVVIKGEAPKPAAPPPPKEKKAASAEIKEIVASDSAFLKQLLGSAVDEPAKPKKEKKAEPAESAKAEAGEEAKKEEEKKAEPEKRTKVTKVEKKPEFNSESMLEAAATAGAMAAEKRMGRKEAAPVKSEDAAAALPDAKSLAKELPEDLAADADTFLEMARMNPERYDGAWLKKLRKFKNDQDAYERKWLKEHAGETFDPESDEHESFYVDHEPRYDQSDYKQAEREIAIREAEKRISQKLTPEIEQAKQHRVIQEAAPALKAAAFDVFKAALAGVNEEHVNIAGNVEKLTELEKADPIASDVIVNAAKTWNPIAEAAVLWHRGGVKLPAEHPVVQLREELAGILSANKPSETTLPDGRRFATPDEFLNMSRVQQAKHWTVGEEQLVEYIALKARNFVTNSYAAEKKVFDERVKRMGFVPAAQGKPAEPPVESAPAKPAEEPAPAESKPVSPPIGGMVTIGDKVKGDVPKDDFSHSPFLKQFFAR